MREALAASAGSCEATDREFSSWNYQGPAVSTNTGNWESADARMASGEHWSGSGGGGGAGAASPDRPSARTPVPLPRGPGARRPRASAGGLWGLCSKGPGRLSPATLVSPQRARLGLRRPERGPERVGGAGGAGTLTRTSGSRGAAQTGPGPSRGRRTCAAFGARAQPALASPTSQDRRVAGRRRPEARCPRGNARPRTRPYPPPRPGSAARPPGGPDRAQRRRPPRWTWGPASALTGATAGGARASHGAGGTPSAASATAALRAAFPLPGRGRTRTPSSSAGSPGCEAAGPSPV